MSEEENHRLHKELLQQRGAVTFSEQGNDKPPPPPQNINKAKFKTFVQISKLCI